MEKSCVRAKQLGRAGPFHGSAGRSSGSVQGVLDDESPFDEPLATIPSLVSHLLIASDS